jgi:ornithine cyclodeaminase/alanine dehydrogenase-like protein (mu-crystallin family)
VLALAVGDLNIPLTKGVITVASHVRGELGEFVPTSNSAKPPKTLPALSSKSGSQDLTFFKSVGVAVQDVATAQAVLSAAEKMGLGIVSKL